MSDINISGYPQRGQELVEMLARVIDNPDYFKGDDIPDKIKLTEEQYLSMKDIDGLEEQDDYDDSVPVKERVCLYFTGEYIMDVEVI